MSYKGKDTCFAWVAGGCGAEACTSRQWMVTFDNKTFAEAPLVKIVAEAEVCSCCMLSCAILTAHLPPLLSLTQTPEGKAKSAAEAKAKAEAKAAAEAKAKAEATAAAEVKASAEAKAAVEVKAAAEAAEKAKYSQTVEILQRLDLHAHIPAFM